MSAHRRVFVLLALILLVVPLLLSCSGDGDSARYIARFQEREVDLEPFLQGYPYSWTSAEIEQGKLLYFETRPGGQWLRTLDLESGAEVALADGHKIGEIDWSTRSWGDGRFHEPSGRYCISSDERNDEHINVYALDLDSGAIEQLTDSDYTYGWTFSKDGRLLAYIDRSGLEEPFVSCLRIRDMVTGDDRSILCDEGGDDRFTWTEISFAPDNRSVILSIQHDGNRRTTTLTRIDLEYPSFDWLQEPRVARYGLGLVEGWVGNDRFLYRVAAGSDHVDLHLYDLDTHESRQLTNFQAQLRGAFLLDGASPKILLALRRPHESEIQLLDATSGELLTREVIPASANINDAHGDRAVLTLTDLTTPLSLEWLRVVEDGGRWTFERSALASMPAALEEKIVHCRGERVSFPTFDTLEDGSPRMLHAFYLEPETPPADPADRLVRITAFYGGGNHYSQSTHILGAAGVATFSPAVRGSWGWGAEFSSLNDGDLGGDEIIDLFYAARYLVDELGYEPRQIGVHGGSHGGYATMRALTFPPETNGRGESFPFGWGHSGAGMSDIISYYESCNIPDWVLLEAGDPVTEREKLLDRSPITHVDRLVAPLLLTHGSNDWRVPVEQSRRFAEKARELGRPVTYVEFPGQGHGISGLENNRVYYQAIFTFLESLERPR